MSDDTLQFCTFTLDNLLFGVEATKVKEVSRDQEITHVPLASEEIEGLMNLRGQVIMAINLRVLMKLNRRSPDEDESMNVVLRSDEEAISLIVDDIGDVIDLEETEFELPPGTMDKGLKGLITGVFKLGQHQLLHVLDTEQILNA